MFGGSTPLRASCKRSIDEPKTQRRRAPTDSETGRIDLNFSDPWSQVRDPLQAIDPKITLHDAQGLLEREWIFKRKSARGR